MHVETICPGCQRKLRVGSEHIGKQARCPLCNAIYTVPTADESRALRDPNDQWRMQTPEGQEYGPVTREVLENWIMEGRISDDCKLLCEAENVWHSAGGLYPVLRPVQAAAAVIPWYGEPGDPAPISPEEAATHIYRGHVTNSHRGGAILALGILSWAIGCPIFGVLAWVMGSNDLREMRQGTMNADGRSLTEAGRIIGMLHTFLALTALVVLILALLILKVI